VLSHDNFRIPRAISLVTLSLLFFAGCSGDDPSRHQAGSAIPPAPPPGPVKYSTQGVSRVFVVVLENHEYSQVVGNDQAPYLNELAAQGALLTNFYAVTHPSLPNYLAILGGSTFGITYDCTGCSARDPNLALQLSKAGLSWRAYMEGMPKPCFQGGWAYPYAKKHDPFMYFPSIRESRRCRWVVPASRLQAELRTGRLPRFGWLTPDLCNDAHDCGLPTADRYLATIVPQILHAVGPHGFLVLTFDEGISSQRGGGRIATILLGPDVRNGAKIGASYTHYSLLRTLEDAFGLAHLRAARQAQPLRAAFLRYPVLR
jgi:phosphatidylinositol-3-phosphatase